MTSPAVALATVGGAPRWIASAPFDLAFFVLSPIAGIAVVWASGLTAGPIVLAAATYLIAIPHYLSSFSFFLGDDLRLHYLGRFATFVVVPIAILVAVVLLRLSGHDAIVQVAMFLWNIWHVALQSSGILALYRRLNGGPDGEMPAARAAILGTNTAMALFYVERFPPLHDMLAALGPHVPSFVSWTSIAGAGYGLVRLSRALARRPRPISLPEVAFLTTSLALFHPYLWVYDANLATFAMLMGHFFQYLAIVWLLHRRKYGEADGSRAQRALGRVAASTPLLLVTLAGSGVALYATSLVARAFGAPLAYVILWNALTLVHFYLDGFIWAFRNPFVRRTIGPYLAPAG